VTTGQYVSVVDQRLGGWGAVISLSRGTARVFIFMAKAPFQLAPILLRSFAMKDQKAKSAYYGKCSYQRS
jgi:hypothetical protein